MVGIMAGIAIPAFMDYMKKPKQTEASLQLNKLGKNLKVIYIEKGEFPMGSVGPTPAKSCCAFDRMKCFEPAAWQDPLWQQLDFMIDEPHLMRYSYESKDGKSFVAKAHADLDCDGQETEWVLTGKIDNGGPVVDLVAPPPGEY
jgi:type II secretory pathway pseudopilin PulG